MLLSVDSPLREELQNKVYGDETLMWVGKPRPVWALWSALKEHIRSLNPVGFVTELLVIGVFFYYLYSKFFNVKAFIVLTGNYPEAAVIAAVVGAGVLVAILWHLLRSLKSEYAVTDKRLIVITRNIVFYPAMQSLHRGKIERRDHRDGTSDLIFARQERKSGSSGDMMRFTYWVEIGFVGIENAGHVEQLVLEMFQHNSLQGESASVAKLTVDNKVTSEA